MNGMQENSIRIACVLAVWTCLAGPWQLAAAAESSKAAGAGYAADLAAFFAEMDKTYPPSFLASRLRSAGGRTPRGESGLVQKRRDSGDTSASLTD